jgi:aminopeptidase N
MSVPFQPVKDEVDGIKLNIFAPEAEKVADLHLLAMQDTIHWFNQHIYPYPGKQLNIVAFPNIGPTGYALPQVILINNRVGFRATPSADAGFDQRYRRAVHETAHQWFGHTLGNGVEYDRSFLIESMAKYIELVMIEQRYGQAAVDSLVAYEDGRYRIAQARSSRPTQALVDAEASHDAYSRSTIVFTRLRETMGDEPIIDALKQLFVDHAFPNPPATSMDFVRALKQQSEGIHHKLIEDLLINDDITMLLE